MSKKIFKSVVVLTFVIYIGVLALLLILANRGGFSGNMSMLEYAQSRFNIIPFKTIIGYITSFSTNGGTAVKNILGNFLLFLPMGIYLPYLFKKVSNYKRFLVVMFIILFAIEVLQFVLKRGAFDIDDLILNLLGAVIGFGLWKVINKKS